MNVLIVLAHPDPNSLNASLCQVCVDELRTQGHSVQVSDLYAMGFKAVVDRADFPQLGEQERLKVAAASAAAYASGTLTDDVQQEITKLKWADALILNFPLWWYSMPAILKGWVDRVFAYGFAYGVGEHSDARWGDRFGEGALAGKRGLFIDAPIAYRRQNGGDYEIPSCELRPGLEAEGVSGFGLHVGLGEG